ncbi:MAG: hypothetical protein K1X44_00010 [Alphaproteobacteria bacterium]|nr:hypothetical protein [Alphaproteobacteria bacterium]
MAGCYNFPINDFQKSFIKDLMAKGDFPRAYDFVAEISRGQIPEGTRAWYEHAVNINQGIGFDAAYIREYTRFAQRLLTGKELTNDELQAMSDDIAREVLGFTEKWGLIRCNVLELVKEDIMVATELHNLNHLAWAGYYFSEDVLGINLMKEMLTPEELEQVTKNNRQFFFGVNPMATLHVNWESVFNMANEVFAEFVGPGPMIYRAQTMQMFNQYVGTQIAQQILNQREISMREMRAIEQNMREGFQRVAEKDWDRTLERTGRDPRKDFRAGVDACFAGGTPILMADGSTKPIEQIIVGDKVMGFHGLCPLEPAKVIKTYRHEGCELYELAGPENNKIKVTATHPFLTIGGRFKELGFLTPHDKLVLADGTPKPMGDLNKQSGLYPTYNFTVEGLHTYVAGGYRVHNKYVPPIVLDMDGDGVELISIGYSKTFYDYDGDGYKENVGWVSRDDALVGIDLDGDGTLSGKEISFADQTIETDTDLEALAKLYDSNKDGILDKADSDFSKFKVWQDMNSDGVVNEGELQTFDAAEITSLSLKSDQKGEDRDGNIIYGKTTYTKKDGSTKELADVALAASSYGYRQIQKDGGSEVELEGEGKYFVADAGTTLNFKLKDTNYIGAYGNDGNDILSGEGMVFDQVSITPAIENEEGTTQENVGGFHATSPSQPTGILLDGGTGDDTLTGSKGNDWLSGGKGKDTLHGGEGDDRLFIDADDVSIALNSIDGGEGYDVAVVSGEVGITLDVATARLEAVQGGLGDDVLDASGYKVEDNLEDKKISSVSLDGGAGDDRLVGGGGNDVLSGGVGQDFILGNGGDDTILADSDDQIDAGDGVDTVIFESSSGVIRNAATLNAEILLGTQGDDSFTTTDSHGVALFGQGGDDQLAGSRGSDTLSGGTGDDTITGGGGDDSYRFGRGDGVDEITDKDQFQGQNFHVEESWKDVQASYQYRTVVTRHKGGKDPETWYDEIETQGSQNVKVLDYKIVEGLEELHLDGGKDTIEFEIGITKDDLLFEVRGNDLLIGIKPGLRPAGSGLHSTSSGTAEAGSASAPTIAHDCEDVVVLKNWVDTKDRIEKIKFADERSLASTSEAEASTIDIAELLVAQLRYQQGLPPVPYDPTKVEAELLRLLPTRLELKGDGTKDTTLTGGRGHEILDTSRTGLGSSGPGSSGLAVTNDTLTGGQGDDVLKGGLGNDTYIFNRGDGWDEILDGGEEEQVTITKQAYKETIYVKVKYTETTLAHGSYTVEKYVPYEDSGERITETHQMVRLEGGQDTLKLGTGIGIEDIAIRMKGNDLVLALRDSTKPEQSWNALSDKIKIKDWNDTKNRVETLELADGTKINLGAIVSGYSGDKGDEWLVGDSGGNWLSGGAGDDVFVGYGGQDVLIG